MGKGWARGTFQGLVRKQKQGLVFHCMVVTWDNAVHQKKMMLEDIGF